MKVKIGKYKNWFGPYQLAEALCFWMPKEKDEFGFPRTNEKVHKFGEWLAHGSILPDDPNDTRDLFSSDSRKTTWLYDLLLWIDSKRKRKQVIKIDPWDTWNMDTTLAYIIVPMLKQLKATKHGSPHVDLEDLPDHLRPTAEAEKAYLESGELDAQFFDRFDWVLDEMIFAFEHFASDDDWEEKYTKGTIDYKSVPVVWDENGKPKYYEMVPGPNHTYERDEEAIKEIHKRIDNGLRLFGKYYRSLWD